MLLEILTPEQTLFEGDVDSVVVPGIDGSLGILNNHAPLISALAKGTVKTKAEGNVTAYDIEGGVVEVLKNKVIILAE